MLKFTIIAIFLFSACSKDKDDDPGQSVPNGTYTLTPGVCVSSGEAPEFEDANSKASFFYFTDSKIELIVDGGEGTIQISSDDCEMSLEQTISVNSSGYFAFREKREASSDPKECLLNVLHDETTFEFSSAHPIFNSGEEDVNEILYLVEPKGDEIILRTRDENPDQQIWQAFGCAKTDQIEIRLKK